MAHQVTRSGDTAVPPEIRAEYTALAEAVATDGYVAFAKLYGFTGAPPSPGSAATWGVDEWLEYGRRNTMNDVRTVAHGTKITHDVIKDIAVAVSSSPGDVRAGMNCASDFRRLFNRVMAYRWVGFNVFTELALVHGLRVNGTVPRPALLAEVAAADINVTETLKLGFPDARRSVAADDITLNANKVYTAMTYLAREASPPLAYPELLMRVCADIGLSTTRDKMGALSKIIGHAFRTKEPLELPRSYGFIVEAMLTEALDHKERAALDREMKRSAREKEEAVASAVPDTAAAMAKVAEKTKDQFTELLTRFGHDIAQLNERFAKAKAAAAGLDFNALIDVAVGHAKRVDELDVRCKVLEATVENYIASTQEIAKLVDVDPKSAELSSQIKDRVGAYREAADGADKVRDRLVAFATKVHDKLSTKDFLAIASAITELLPESEKLAITGGDDE